MGVSRSTVQRYCDSGILRLHRTLGGHRRLYAEDVARWLKDSQAKKRRPKSLARGKNSRDKITLKTAANAFLDGKPNRLESLVDRVLLGEYRFAKLCDDYLLSCWQNISERRSAGKISVAEEWRALSCVLRFVNEFGVLPRNEGDPISVGFSIGCRSLGFRSKLLERLLRHLGQDAFHCETDPSIESVGAVVRQVGPSLVWLTVEEVTDYQVAVAFVRNVHAALPPHCKLVLMGEALNPTFLKFLPKDFVAESFEAIAEYVAFHSQLIHSRASNPGSQINNAHSKLNNSHLDHSPLTSGSVDPLT